MAAVSARLLAWISLLCVGVLAPVAVEIWHTQQQGAQAQKYARELQHFATLGYRRSSELMKARAGIVGHYDALVQTDAAIRGSLLQLEGLDAFLAGVQAEEMVRELEELRQGSERASELLERFKRNQSILRNSLRYLPVVSKEMDSATMFATTRRHAADELIHDTLLMETWPDAEVARRVEERLAEVEGEQSEVPAQAGSAMEAAIAHLETAARVAPIVRYITKEIIDLRGGPRASDFAQRFVGLQARIDEDYDRIRAEALLLGLCAFVFAAGAVLVRVSRSEAAERRVSDELKRALSSLREEQAKQAELAELKSKFVSMASHEFRTPLSVILSSSEMLEAYDEMWSSDRRVEHFDRIRTAARGMTEMLDGILVVGRSDAGMLRCERERVNIEQLCSEVVADVESASGGRDRIVRRGPDAGLEAMVDYGLLRQALANVLSNALKYSPDSETVRFDVACQDEKLVFRVRDEGIGISEHDRARLFETFHRGKNVGRVAGSGLGLAIVKRAVELHGGQVAVESQLGNGSTFTLDIPLQEQTS